MSLCERSQAEDSVREAPNPSISWYFVASLTVMVKCGARAAAKVKAAFSCRVSCSSSEDSYTSIGET